MHESPEVRKRLSGPFIVAFRVDSKKRAGPRLYEPQQPPAGQG
jgi:hypothetical protein